MRSSGIAAPFTSTKGRAARGEAAVEGAGDDLLADAALAGDEDARVRGPGPPDLLAQARHRGALAEERLLLLQPLPLPRDLAGEDVPLAGEAAPLERLLERQEDPLERERLLEEVVGAALHGLDGRLHRAVPRDHEDGQVVAARADLVEDGEAVDVGEPDVEEERRGRGAARLGEPREDRRPVLELLHAVPLVAEDLRERPPDAGRVVADEHRHAPRPGALTVSSARGASRGRPFEDEAASARRILLQDDPPAVLGGDARGDGEAEAEAVRLRREGRLEDEGALLGRNPGPVVGDDDAGPPLLDGDADGDLARRRASRRRRCRRG